VDGIQKEDKQLCLQVSGNQNLNPENNFFIDSYYIMLFLISKFLLMEA